MCLDAFGLELYRSFSKEELHFCTGEVDFHVF